MLSCKGKSRDGVDRPSLAGRLWQLVPFTGAGQSPLAADGWRHERIQLLQVNPAFEAITLEPEDAGDPTIVGELMQNFILNPPR